MHIKISHDTTYSFTKAVFLEPHYLRFKPKAMPFLEVKSYNLQLSVTPSGISEQLDAEGNVVHFCWFDGMHDSIIIKSEAILDIAPFLAFNFLVHPTSCNLIPFQYPEQQRPMLSLYMEATPISNALFEYGQRILKSVQSNTISFLLQLTKQIHIDFSLEIREVGIPFHANDTFQGKTGSCRDLSWMQIQLLRNLGLAARFVSGYYYIEIEFPHYELHAWVEVFIPGAGWIGFDPSNGIATANMHIPVCSSVHYENTMPVSGSIRGDAHATLSTNLHMEMMY
ncbi:transglutaminase family protein [Formosa algae]|nr:transglutaminase family protein [Formosa algae]OEI81530.1 transglutaminase [Formosa algae]